MKPLTGWLAAALVLSAAVSAHADNSMGSTGSMMSSTPAKLVIYTPSSVKWVAGTGEFKGLTIAMLSGDPAKPGPWTIRLKVPAGTKFPVHYHADTEVMTVISGTFQAGVGTVYDASKLVSLPAGSYVVIPAGVRHYGHALTATIAQLSGTQPFGMKMDKPSM